MTEIIGVRFKKAGKIYYFDPEGASIDAGTPVIVETSRGVEFGNVVVPNKLVADEEISPPFKRIIRVANEEDLSENAENKNREKEALEICAEKIQTLGLEMKLVGVELTFDRSKLIFYFTAAGRVDFRELVKELAAVFRTRIELRQIGVRDESKILNSIGICGRPLCCATYLADFQPVSIKMAKEQNLSLNPTKISGICGRLMCCLKYEEETYEYLLSRLPQLGCSVNTPDGKGEVVDINVLKQLVKVEIRDKERDITNANYYPVEDIEVLRSAPKPKPAPTEDKRGGHGSTGE